MQGWRSRALASWGVAGNIATVSRGWQAKLANCYSKGEAPSCVKSTSRQLSGATLTYATGGTKHMGATRIWAECVSSTMLSVLCTALDVEPTFGIGCRPRVCT